jgi:hypothetical protein
MAGLVPAIHDFVGAMQPLQCPREAYSLVLQRQRLRPIRQHLTAGPCIVATGTRAPTTRLAAQAPQLEQLRRVLQVRWGRHDPLRGATCVRGLHVSLAARQGSWRAERRDPSMVTRPFPNVPAPFGAPHALKQRSGSACFSCGVYAMPGRAFKFSIGAQGAKRQAQTKSFQPAPGRDSYWSRAEPRYRPSAELACSARGRRNLVQLRRNDSRSDPWRTRPSA